MADAYELLGAEAADGEPAPLEGPRTVMLRAMNPLTKRLLVVSAAVVLVYAAGTAIRASLGITFDAASLRDRMLELGPAAPLLFVVVVAARSLLGLPSQIVLVAAGLCFGTVVGSVVGGAGLTLSGLALFAGARYAGRDVIERRLGDRVGGVLDLTRRRSGVVFFAFAFGYPISPLSPLQAAAGWTRMSTAGFVVAAMLGGMLRAAIFAGFGDALIAASGRALLAPLALLAAALALPLTTAAGRAWLRDLFGRGVSTFDPSANAPPSHDAIEPEDGRLRRRATERER